jgi:hypothetical protein
MLMPMYLPTTLLVDRHLNFVKIIGRTVVLKCQEPKQKVMINIFVNVSRQEGLK